MFLLKVLKNAHYQTLSATNGEEALERLHDYPTVAIILMDCQMPVMDGYECTRLIRQVDKFKMLPIIAVTANVSEDDQRLCKEAGMSDFISKPISKNAIEKALIKYLRVNN